MAAIARVISITMVAIGLASLGPQTAVAQQSGPRSDRPAKDGQHDADPCAHAPDPDGGADGIDRRCALGGSGGVGRGDFNNDGIADLAVGVPDETRQSVQCDGLSGCTTTDHAGAGAVNVIYGGAGGLTATGSQVLSQSLSSTSTNAHFGRALAAGTFRGPGFASDLAVGAPGVRKSGALVGAIYVFFSESGRLRSTPSQTFFADAFSSAGTSLGSNPMDFPPDMSMVWGDFNGDGFGDLAAEVVNGGVSHDQSRSAVLVLYGSTSGLSRSNYTLLVVDDALRPDPTFNPGCGVQRPPCLTSRGHVGLGAGDLDGDGRAELLIGAAACRQVDDDGDFMTGGPQGCVAVVPGRTPVLTHSGWDVLLSDTGGTARFGVAVAVGDVDGDGRKDVAVGAPEDDIDPGLASLRAGSVRIYTNPAPCCLNLAATLSQNSTNGSQVAEAGDRFGAALATNDFDADGFADLSVGSPGESTGNNVEHGLVTVFFGAGGGLPGTRTPSSTLTSFGTPFLVNGAAFGSSLSAWNFGSGAPPDLAIGAPGFIIRPPNGQDIQGAGGVMVLYGQAGNPFTNPQLWTQNPGFTVCSGGTVTCLRTAGKAAPSNHFGAALY